MLWIEFISGRFTPLKRPLFKTTTQITLKLDLELKQEKIRHHSQELVKDLA